MREYLILSETSTADLQNAINATNKTHKDFKTHGWKFVTPNYLVLVSYQL